MAELYSNENFLLPVVEKPRQLGHDVLTIQETGKGEQSVSDEAVLTPFPIKSSVFWRNFGC